MVRMSLFSLGGISLTQSKCQVCCGVLLYIRSNRINHLILHIRVANIMLYMYRKYLSIVLPQSLQQDRRVRSNHLIHLLPILEEQKRRHGADTQLLAQPRQLIYVEFDKVDLVLELCFFRSPIISRLLVTFKQSGLINPFPVQ
jgi:hypothetical protein